MSIVKHESQKGQLQCFAVDDISIVLKVLSTAVHQYKVLKRDSLDENLMFEQPRRIRLCSRPA
jgi:hypothetical protein